MSTLTDRYVWAVVRSLPEAQRADLDRELRASIGDSVEDRVASGEGADVAERAALLELGDPDQLAAGYADRRTYLIGPTYYFTYLRLLKLLYAVVLPITAVVIAGALVISGEDVGKIFGGVVSSVIGLAVHLGFWPTLVFAIIERSSAEHRSGFPAWSLDALPDLPAKKQVGLVDVIAGVVMVVFFVGAVLWQQFNSVVSNADGPVALLDPGLWGFWLPYFFALAVVEVLFYLLLYRNGRWTPVFAAVNVILGLAFAIPAVWLLANDLVINHAFTSGLGWQPPTDAVLTNVAIAMVVVFSLWDWIDGVIKTVRARPRSASL